jgi:uncharacterized protein YkwD
MRAHSALRPLVIAVASLVFIGTATQPAAAQVSGREKKLYHKIDNARDNHGVPHIALNHDISKMARNHSKKMSNQNHLSHSCLTCKFSGWNWHALGENVVKAKTVAKAHKSLMGSPDHRSNILGSQYSKVGVGIVESGGWLWVTQMFYG